MRSYSPLRLLGGGVVYNGVASRRKRHSATDIFTHYRRGAIEQLAVLHVQESGFRGLTLPELALRLGVSEKKLRKLLEAPLSNRQLLLAGGTGQQLIACEAFETMKERTVCLLASFHDDFPDRDGLSVEELRSMVYGGMDPKIMRLLLDDLAKGGTAQTVAEAVRLSSNRPLSSRTAERLRQELADLFRQAALAPPPLREIIARFPRQGPKILQGVMDGLSLAGTLCKVNDDLYFHHQAMDEFRERVILHLREQGSSDIQGFKTLTDMTRKFLVPVLEYFDKTGITQRIDDSTRVLRSRLRTEEDASPQLAAGENRATIINQY